MTTQQTMRRTDQSIKIGQRHGYRIEGDHAIINAELELPPYLSGGEWGLELWATEQPYHEGALTGTRVAEVPLELPTPIGPYVHQVDTRVTALLPLQGRAYSMVLALIGHGANEAPNVHAFANYPDRQTFTAPHLEGPVGYSVQGNDVVLEAAGVFNPRHRDNLSGTLSLELWALPVAAPSTEGWRLAASELGCVAGQAALATIERRVAFSQPPVGRFQVTLLLREWTAAHGFVTRDRRDFASIYERFAAESPAAPSAPIVAAPPVPTPARSTERLRLVPGAKAKTRTKPDTKTADVVAPPTIAGLVSIQTATVDELAAVKGLTLKLAKEIVKARPFMSLADLTRVRGIGDKTVVRLKHLLTL